MKKFLLPLLAVLLSSSQADARGLSLLLGSNGGLSAYHATFGRSPRNAFTSECSIINVGVLIPFSDTDALLVSTSLTGPAYLCGEGKASDSVLDVTYQWLRQLKGHEDVRFTVGLGLRGGHLEFQGATFGYAGPSVRFGFDIGDDNVALRPYAYLRGIIAESTQQRVMFGFSAGLGVEVAFGLP